jgi:hypothetical protein
MRKRIPDHFISALIGGVIGAVVVLFVAGQKAMFEETAHAQIGQFFMPAPDVSDGKFKTLEVERLIITEQAELRNAEGKPELFIRDGSVLAEKRILGNKLVGQHVQAHSIVANRMFATPDNLVSTPREEWRFFTEIGATNDAGGEVVIRSFAGSATVGVPTNTGSLLRLGYSPEQQPQILAFENSDRSPIPVSFELSEEQRRMLEILNR